MARKTKQQYIKETNELISLNNDYYIISLRFINNNTNGQANRDIGAFLISQNMRSLTGTTTGTAWIGVPSEINIDAIIHRLNNDHNNISYHVFRSTHYASSEIVKAGGNQIKKIGNDIIKPEEHFQPDEEDPVDRAQRDMKNLKISKRK